MKTKYLFYALICIMSIGKIKSADLYVRDMGAGGAYTTISAAITAASDGDRIIIQPKIGNVPYIENLTINKSLTFVSETNFSKYYVQGTITLVPAVDRVITLNNMRVFQNGISTSTVTLSGGRSTINIINCISDAEIDLDNSKNVTANVSQTTCTDLYFVHGKIIGNDIRYLYLNNDAAPLATSDVYIVANKSSGNTINNNSYILNFLNNYVDDSSPSIFPIDIVNFKSGTTNTIQNNFLKHTPSFSINGIRSVNISSPNPGIINIINNIFHVPNSGSEEIIASTQPTVIANNNLSYGPFNSTNVDILNDNISAGVYTLNINTGASTGAIINAGLPNEEYQDLDLTRNDIGPFGGSNSWVNYWPANAGNKPRVMFLNTPRRVYVGTTTIQAEAIGISK